MLQMPPQGPPPGPSPLGQAGPSDPLADKASLLNPPDLAMMQKKGGLDPNMTVMDVLQQFGIDPNGPATQLLEFGQQQAQNATALGKATPPGGMPPGGPAGGPPQGPPPDMAGLMQGV